MVERQLVCPNCRAENLPNALVCYKCNAKMPSAPSWVGPASFTVYDAKKDRGIAYMVAIFGAVIVLVSAFLTWLGVPKDVDDAGSRGTSAFDILFGASGSKSAIGNGGVGDSSLSLDVRLFLLLMVLAAVVTIIVAIIKPLFPLLLVAGIVSLIGPIYFFLQLVLRNNAQFNTPDLVALLRIGFWLSLFGSALIIGVSFRYRTKPTFQPGQRY